MMTIEPDHRGHGVPSTLRAPLWCVLGRLFLCSYQTEATSMRPESALLHRKEKRVNRSNLFHAAKTVRQQLIGKCSLSFPNGPSPWGSTPENSWEGRSPGTIAHTLPATPKPPGSAALASNPYKPTSSCTLPGVNPLTLQTELPSSLPAAVSLCPSMFLPLCVCPVPRYLWPCLYISVSPCVSPCLSLSVLVSRCLWPCLCVSGPVSMSLCLPLPLPACSLVCQQEGTHPFLGKPILGGSGDRIQSQGTRRGGRDRRGGHCGAGDTAGGAGDRWLGGHRVAESQEMESHCRPGLHSSADPIPMSARPLRVQAPGQSSATPVDLEGGR